jgi:mycothiol synthase
VTPPRHAVRAPTADDAEAVLSVFAAYNTATVGFADCTLDDIIDNFAEPGLDLATDAWLAETDGRPSGYGCVFAKPGSAEHDIEVAASDPALARSLLDRVIERSRTIAREAGHAEVSIHTGVYRTDSVLRPLLAEAGFTTGTTFHRMRIDHHGPVPVPKLPAGVTQRSAADDPSVRRAAYEIAEAAFAGQFHVTSRPYDEWLAAHEAKPTFSWSQLTVLERDGVPVAMREDNDQFLEDEDCNYIATLAVLEEARGLGLAKLLLRQAFTLDAAAGRTGTILHVDTNNPTPALGLYTSVGMEPVLIIDAWHRTFPT